MTHMAMGQGQMTKQKPLRWRKQTDFSDFHHMIYTIPKTTYVKKEPKIIKYRNYEKFSHEEFLAEVNRSLQTSKPESYDEFEEIIVKIPDKHAPIKTAVVRGNNKPHMTEESHDEYDKAKKHCK